MLQKGVIVLVVAQAKNISVIVFKGYTFSRLEVDQERAPRFHSYTKPRVKITRKRIIFQKPAVPTFSKPADQGKSKAISTSKIKNKIPTI